MLRDPAAHAADEADGAETEAESKCYSTETEASMASTETETSTAERTLSTQLAAAGKSRAKGVTEVQDVLEACLNCWQTAGFELEASNVDMKDKATLGQGSSCLVFKGQLRSSGTSVAVKVLKPQLTGAETSQALSDLRMEIRIGCALPVHANLPQFVGFCEAMSSRPQVLWEMIPGRNLMELYRSFSKTNFGKRWSPKQTQALDWGVQLFDALDVIHTCGMVHRDVQPANIMITTDMKTLKLIDFGLCKYIGTSSEDDEPRCMTEMTGSFRYMAPEVMLGCRYSFPVDIYSGAVVMSFMLTGLGPSTGVDAFTFAQLAARVDLRPSLVNVKDMDLRQVLGRGWAPAACERPSARGMAEMLTEIRNRPNKTVLVRLKGAARKLFRLSSAGSPWSAAGSPSLSRTASADSMLSCQYVDGAANTSLASNASYDTSSLSRASDSSQGHGASGEDKPHLISCDVLLRSPSDSGPCRFDEELHGSFQRRLQPNLFAKTAPRWESTPNLGKDLAANSSNRAR